MWLAALVLACARLIRGSVDVACCLSFWSKSRPSRVVTTLPALFQDMSKRMGTELQDIPQTSKSCQGNVK